MNVKTLTPDARKSVEPCAATIGFFDGVHRGHRYLIRQVTDYANSLGVASTVVTFDRHPRQVVKTDYRPQLLSTLDEKLQLLAATGVDSCAVLPFDAQMASLSARDFMLNVLRERLNVTTLITGYDNRFGHNRAEGFEEYVGYGREMGMEVRRAEPFVFKGVNVSSSVVRSLLQEGEVRMAAGCLGYNYRVSGTVGRGEHIGTTIGYPTANLQPSDSSKLIPAGGVYAVRVHLGDGTALKAMLNIGTRPTFGGQSTTIEAHILHFDGDLYGAKMCVEFVDRLRAERKFRTAAELVSQLQKDAEQAESLL